MALLVAWQIAAFAGLEGACVHPLSSRSSSLAYWIVYGYCSTALPHAPRPPTHVRDHARRTVAPVFGMTRCVRVCARAHIVHSSRTETAPQWLTGSPHHRDGRNTCQDLRFTP